jgi:hypothetical protein
MSTKHRAACKDCLHAGAIVRELQDIIYMSLVMQGTSIDCRLGGISKPCIGLDCDFIHNAIGRSVS